MTPEIISLIGGTVGGYVMKAMSASRQHRHEEHKLAIEAGKESSASADSAVARIPISAGKWVRRLIVVSVLGAIILAPFILSFFPEISTVVMLEEKKRVLWGLLGSYTKTSFHEVQGFLMVPELRSVFAAIAGMYFGKSFAR